MAAPAGTATAPAATTAPHTPLHSARPVPPAVHLLESVLHDVLSGGQVRSGTVVILAYATLVGSRSFWFHAVGACSISLVVVLSLVVLVDLSFPFSGSLNVSSDPYRTGGLAELYHQ